MAVYLLHFDHPNGSHKHYLGYTSRAPEKRLAEHMAPQTKPSFAGKLVREGYVPKIAHVWPNWTRTHEHRLKQLSRNNHSYQFRNWCPICHKFPAIPLESEVLNWKDYV